MAHAIAIWHNTPDTWEAVQDLTTKETKYFIKDGDIIKSFADGQWVNTGLTEPISEEQYLSLGIEDLSEISQSDWAEISDIFELIVWDEDLELTDNKWANITTVPFKPLDLLNKEDNFEVLTWSDRREDVAKNAYSIEQGISEGKLFETTVDNFEYISSVLIK